MNPTQVMKGCATVAATECIGLAVKSSAGDEPLVAIAAATDLPAGVVRAVRDDESTLEVEIPGGDGVPVRMSSDCKALDYLYIDADGKFCTTATGTRFAQALEDGNDGSLTMARLAEPVVKTLTQAEADVLYAAHA
ncbi:MAG: hypothetical protein PF904_10875 [Kiritimatiellae bacterium]|jgi:hypothetical protein|nr:hypothetical protein [Kiritimatiellia bacterium]